MTKRNRSAFTQLSFQKDGPKKVLVAVIPGKDQSARGRFFISDDVCLTVPHSQQYCIPLNELQCVPLATEPGISLIILTPMKILRTTDTLLFISHTTNALLFKFRCNIFIGVRIIKEMPGQEASGTHCSNSGSFIWDESVSNAGYEQAECISTSEMWQN